MTGGADEGIPELLVVPDDARRLAEELAPGRWPDIDVHGLLECARRCRMMAAALRESGGEVLGAHRRCAGSGRFPDALSASGEHLGGAGGEFERAAARLDAAATALAGYARTAVDTHNRMAVIATIAARDRAAGALAETLGDDSVSVLAASTGRAALTAAGEDFDERSATLGADVGDGEDQQQSPAGTAHQPAGAASGLAMMGGLAAMSGAGSTANTTGGRTAAGSPEASDAAERDAGADAVGLAARALSLHTGLASPVCEWLRVAVGAALTSDGERVVIVGTSDPQPYQRPGLALHASEILAADGQAPELAIIAYMVNTRLSPQAIGSCAPISSGVAAVLWAEGVRWAAPVGQAR
ncbi:MAG: hypothetical protein QM673_02605 [Gordonia sp. (in: high G+C Gram-positive bacteria)]